MSIYYIGNISFKDDSINQIETNDILITEAIRDEFMDKQGKGEVILVNPEGMVECQHFVRQLS